MQNEHPDNRPLGMPSPEALQTATDAIRRRYVLPETMEHPVVRAECLRLAYLIQAYGLASAKPEKNRVVPKATRCGAEEFWQAPRGCDRRRRHVAQDTRTPELVDA